MGFIYPNPGSGIPGSQIADPWCLDVGAALWRAQKTQADPISWAAHLGGGLTGTSLTFSMKKHAVLNVLIKDRFLGDFPSMRSRQIQKNERPGKRLCLKISYICLQTEVYKNYMENGLNRHIGRLKDHENFVNSNRTNVGNFFVKKFQISKMGKNS